MPYQTKGVKAFIYENKLESEIFHPEKVDETSPHSRGSTRRQAPICEACVRNVILAILVATTGSIQEYPELGTCLVGSWWKRLHVMHRQANEKLVELNCDLCEFLQADTHPGMLTRRSVLADCSRRKTRSGFFG